MFSIESSGEGTYYQSMETTLDTLYGKIVYRTPVGTFDTWELAAAACDRCDLDPTTCIDMVRE